MSKTNKLPPCFFSYDPDDGLEVHSTEDGAREYAKKSLGSHAEAARLGDGWPEGTDRICWGEIREQAQTTESIPRPPAEQLDEDGCDEDGIYWSDFETMERHDFVSCANAAQACDQLRERVKQLEPWESTFALLGGTPEIAWDFHKALETHKIAREARVKELESLIAETLVPALESVAYIDSSSPQREDALVKARYVVVSSAQARIAELFEENAVLKSQVENADVNLEQVRLNARSRFEARIAELEAALREK